MTTSKLAFLSRWRQGGDGSGEQESPQVNLFGTFPGVFVPTVLTILGAIMYLFLGWVVGNAGLGGALLIIAAAHVITISTGLSVSSIATNVRVGAGGAFAIISQSLGLEVGGSVGVPLYLAQTISITLYVLAFTEGWRRIFPTHSETLVSFLCLLFVFLIVYISTQFAARIQYVILAIVFFSLFSLFLGSFELEPISLGMISAQATEGFVNEPVWWGNFESGGFWTIFAVYFPAVTGIMAGIGLSGALKDPRRSIPLGTMSAIGLTLTIYVALAYWLSRVATPEELRSVSTIMVDKAYFGWSILLGILGATFSSALGSLVAAPRVMQALGEHHVLPQFLGEETEKGEPRNALLVTIVIAFLALVFAWVSGGIEALAPIITLFFLIAYTMLNMVVLIEQTLGLVSFRPTFAVPRVVPLVGVLSCLFVMLLINVAFTVVSIVMTLLLYNYLLQRRLAAPFSDVRSGLFLSLAEWAAERVMRLPAAPERTWRPNILAPVASTSMLTGSYRFLRAVAKPNGGVYVLGVYDESRESVQGVEMLSRAFLSDGVSSRTTFLQSRDFVAAVQSSMEILNSTFFRPNILFVPLLDENILEKSNWTGLETLLNQEISRKMGVILLARHPVVELGREQIINVWMREQGPKWELGLRLANLDLSVLLAYQLRRNWNGRIKLCMAVPDSETRAVAEAFLYDLIRLGRLPSNTTVIVYEGAFLDALAATERGDVNMFGLQKQPDLGFVHRIIDSVDASCIFVRDSGNESALA
ncbi:MAG TPA: Na-K-Cl cotransporter [Anaerolineae bacterium]|nr:Na-K-Cl cotransporter [Anaerolineae bacterium]